MNFNRIYQEVIVLVDKTNKILLSGYTRPIKIEYKKGIQLSTSVVTEYDLRVTKLLYQGLTKAFPEIGFLSEEDHSSKLSSDYNWIIDPLDGTANFSYKIPIFGVSLALWKRNTPVFGVISLPSFKEIIHGFVNQGVYLNGKRIQIKKLTQKQRPISIIAQVDTNAEKIKVLSALAKIIPLPLNYQCASFHLGLTALGRVDCSIYVNTSIWDIAAGLLLIQEAGLYHKFISRKPDIFSSKAKGYNISFAAGEIILVNQVANCLTSL